MRCWDAIDAIGSDLEKKNIVLRLDFTMYSMLPEPN